ncbi:GmrSD restriction endonuclease domain-containing protein [Pseudomonas sp. CNPSo 3701]|uniref:GmrSD restriction endonuclease domain-containing protein n=1 Tax=Pseudomonas sp. CNPSo 3701 TaxID=3027943 RepID=UPI0023641FC2|nr:DUF262 domain-containing protein [Pseudomonas sp. CNPSo 3701]MDD1508602.1 DUF262 domain-containing protein [Pseudomonas sp. CNPSo 3701]
MSTVNLDALVQREDFEVQTDGDEAPIQQTIQVRDLEKSAFFYGALRKPDFQRETSEWEPKRVANLIKTFIDGELIPAVILWKNRDLLFVIDGSHRLSALISWVQDDYGDGSRSQDFFSNSIPEDQIKIAQRTREQINKEIGSYADHKRAIENPNAFDPEIVARARRLGSLALQLQWVRGDATKAESSFIRINQQAAMITPQELELIKSRNKPNAIAARAIIRKGTGHKYWSSFSESARGKIEKLANEIHELIFDPTLRYPIKSLDLPLGGAVYSSTALRMVYDLVCISTNSYTPPDDDNGQKTIDYLTRTKRVTQLILSNHSSSLGLHPAVYFYSWTGKQQSILLLIIVQLAIKLEQEKRLPEFISARKNLEEYLINNRALLNQIIRKFGTKTSGSKHLLSFYEDIIRLIHQGHTEESITNELIKNPAYSYLQPSETPYDGVTATKFSTQVKSGLLMRELIQTASKCAICGGLVPHQAISIDHKKRRRDGGSNSANNAQVTHPFCNTGIKG